MSPGLWRIIHSGLLLMFTNMQFHHKKHHVTSLVWLSCSRLSERLSQTVQWGLPGRPWILTLLMCRQRHLLQDNNCYNNVKSSILNFPAKHAIKWRIKPKISFSACSVLKAFLISVRQGTKINHHVSLKKMKHILYFFVFETRFFCVTLAVLELILWARLDSNS